MLLLTKELLKKIPSTDAAYSTKDPMVWVKFFYPDFSWTWYLCGYDPENDIAYGLVDGEEIEIGDFSLQELRQTKSRLGLSIERDLHFDPLPLSQLAKELKKQYPDRTIWGWSD
jgi:hypothetical protein